MAEKVSYDQGGQFWGRADGLTWVYQRHVEYVCRESSIADVEAARIIVQSLGIDPGYSYSGMARKLVQWTGISQRYTYNAERLLHATGWHYYRCIPGAYEDMALHDIKSCYYSLLCLMPSPLLSVEPDGVRFIPLAPEARVRWREMLALIGEHKMLRNVLIGTLCGGCPMEPLPSDPEAQAGGRLPGFRGARSCWHRGKRLPLGRSPGPLRAAGLLAVRSAWELTALAAEQCLAVYSNTDCIISPSPVPPQVWLDARLSIGDTVRGPAHVCALGCYSVGAKQTQFYASGLRPTSYTPPPTIPPVLYSRSFL